jgi:transcription elongation factor GreB
VPKPYLEQPNYISPQGLAILRERYNHLFKVERPQVVETVSWAAGNGDRSENGDYIYGKKRLREIDWELGSLSRKMKAARIVDPADQPDKSKVMFGATVTIADDQDRERVLIILGDDEIDPNNGRIGWNSPFGRALRGASVGDSRKVKLPAGEVEFEVIAIRYP